MSSKLIQETNDAILLETSEFLLLEDFSVMINGVECSSVVDIKSFSLSDSLYSAADTARFDVLTYTGQTYFPEPNDIVEVFENGEKLFGGVIVKVDKDIDLALNIVTSRVSCTDYGQLLNRQLIIERIENSTVDDIIDFLVAKYATDFDALYVDAPIAVKSITFNNITVSQALEKLAKLTNYSWYVDYDKHIHFFEKESVAAPFSIVDGNGYYIPDTLTITTDLTQIKNRITVRGGEVEVNEVTLELTGDKGKVQDNGNTTFDLSYKFSKKPLVTVNSVAKTVGIVGFDDADSGSFDAMWSFEQKYLTFEIYIAPTDDITITGIPLEVVQVRVQDSASIVEYGRWDSIISVPGIKTRDEALQYAEAQLELGKNPEYSGRFSTYSSGLRSGQLLSVSSTKFGITEQFIIQRVAYRRITPDRGYLDVEFSTIRQMTLNDILAKIVGNVEVDELSTEALLSYLEFNESITMSESALSLTSKTGPYQVWPASGSGTGSAAIVNFSTVSA